MSETLRELVVKLTMDSGSFETDIKGTSAAIKQAEANFKQAGAGIKGFEQSLAGAQAKVAMLTSKLAAQNQAVEAYKTKLNSSKQALESNQAQQQKLAQKIDTAKQAYEAQVAATSKDSEASKALAANLQKLEGQQASLERQSLKQAQAIQTGELELTKASTAAAQTEAALKAANAEVAKGSTVWAKFGAATAGAQAGLDKAGKNMSSAGRKMTMGLTVPIIAGAAAALKAFDTIDDGIDTIIRKTGASGPALDSFESSFDKIFTGMKTTAGDVGIAVGEVNTRFGVTGDQLESLSTLFIEFADVAETDLNGSIGKTQKVLSQWGLGAESASGFLGLLTSEAQRTGISVDTLFDSIQANGATLKGMGLNLSQSVQLMANFETAGINSEVAMMALKKSTVEYTKEGKTLEVGLADTIKSIQGAKTETAALAIAQKVFGAKGALEMATAIREGRLSVIGLTADMSQMGGVIHKTFGSINNDTPVLDRVKNKLVSTGAQFGKSLLPFIEQAAGKLGELVDGFSKMDPAMQKNVMGMAAVAAGIGPVLSGFGKVAQGASALMGFMSGPAGWITLAVAGIAALGFAIGSIPTDADKAAAALKGIKFTLKAGNQAAITDAINAGITGANKIHDITVSVNADTSAIQGQIDLALADKKITPKEFKAISKYINDIVNPDIKAAKTALDLQVAEYKLSLDAAVNAEGKPLTKDQKAAMVAEFKLKQGEALDDLVAAKKDMDRLLLVVKSAGSNATAEQIAELETAIAYVGKLRAEIQITRDQAAQAALADYNLTVAGGGNDQSTAGAVGLVIQNRANDIADAEATKQAALAASTTSANAAADAAAAYVAYDASIVAANTKAQTGLEAIAAGVVASSAGAEKLLTNIDAVSAKYTALSLLTPDLPLADYVDQFLKLFGEDGSLAGLADKSIYDKVLSAILNYNTTGDPADLLQAAGFATGVVTPIKTALATEIGTFTSDPAFDIVGQLLSSLVTAGGISAIDPTTVSGPLLDMLKLVDITSGGKALGDQIPAGIKLGANEGAATYLTSEQLAPIKTALETAIKSMFQIQSPSGLMKPYGSQIAAGLAVGITSNTAAFTDAIAGLYAAATLEANKQEIVLRNHLAWLASTRGSGNTNLPGAGTTNNNTTNNTPITVNASVSSNTDVAVLAAQMADMNRRVLAGYGNA